MTYETFLEKLAATPRTWYFAHNGRIRQKDGYCPIAEANVLKSQISNDLYFKILNSADNEGKYFDSQIRADLLKACGLSETEPEVAQ
jgi:hypothetical protein